MHAMPRIALIVGVPLLALLCFSTYGYFSLASELAASKESLTRSEAESSAREAALSQELDAEVEENRTLSETLRLLEAENDSDKRAVRTLSSTVDDLKKIVATDPELLAKYSKVYFLNENYAPAALSAVPAAFAFEEGRTYEVHTDVLPFLEDLLKDAEKEGLVLRVASSYRSFSAQAALKSGYRVRFGTGANAFSAEQGYSEHQLGTAVDFTTPAIGGTFAGFDRTDAYGWLIEHAHEYGFILSYPKGNAYYQYEPWHWRFVGEDLAERLHEDEDNFYDLDQRVIDSYLGGLFD